MTNFLTIFVFRVHKVHRAHSQQWRGLSACTHNPVLGTRGHKYRARTCPSPRRLSHQTIMPPWPRSRNPLWTVTGGPRVFSGIKGGGEAVLSVLSVLSPGLLAI